MLAMSRIATHWAWFVVNTELAGGRAVGQEVGPNQTGRTGCSSSLGTTPYIRPRQDLGELAGAGFGGTAVRVSGSTLDRSSTQRPVSMRFSTDRVAPALLSWRLPGSTARRSNSTSSFDRPTRRTHSGPAHRESRNPAMRGSSWSHRPPTDCATCTSSTGGGPPTRSPVVAWLPVISALSERRPYATALAATAKRPRCRPARAGTSNEVHRDVRAPGAAGGVTVSSLMDAPRLSPSTRG